MMECEWEASRGAAGGQMIESFEITNFRSFKEQKVRGCGRLNVIVGDNGSGKTALLEALFLASGVSPELISRTRIWRGLEPNSVSGSPEDIDRALWSDLFFDFDTRLKPKIALHGKGRENRSVTISYRRPGTREVLPANRTRQKPESIKVKAGVRFDWDIDGEGHFSITPETVGDKMVYNSPSDAVISGTFLSSNRSLTSGELSMRFSRMSVSHKEEGFVAEFNKHFNRITNLSIELFGGNPLIYATVSGLPQKLPLANASGGMLKFAGILLAIAEFKNGIVIIDEIENGFYFERMPSIWRAILDFAEIYNCQLFVSTHSQECLKSLQTVISETEISDFCFLRTVLDDGETNIRRFDGARIMGAIESNIEVR